MSDAQKADSSEIIPFLFPEFGDRITTSPQEF